jgi:hypothetical protein
VTFDDGGTSIGVGQANDNTGAYSVGVTGLTFGINHLAATAMSPDGLSASASTTYITAEAQGINLISNLNSAEVVNALQSSNQVNMPLDAQDFTEVDATYSIGTDTAQATIQRLYEGLLGRGQDGSGASFYQTLMTAGSSTPVVAQDIMNSPEYTSQTGTQTNQQFVNTLYQNLLGRTGPDESFWTNLLSDGTSKADVASGVANSDEAKSDLASDTSNLFDYNPLGESANAMYETGLGRDVDLGALHTINSYGTTYTAQQLSQTMTIAPEFTALHAGQSNADYVNSLYQNGLGRAADTAGSNFWTGLLSSGQATRADVLLGISQTTEAIDHNTYFGPKPGS